MTYLIEPYFLAVVSIASFTLGFIVSTIYMKSITNKLNTKIKELEDEIEVQCI